METTCDPSSEMEVLDRGEDSRRRDKMENTIQVMTKVPSKDVVGPDGTSTGDDCLKEAHLRNPINSTKGVAPTVGMSTVDDCCEEDDLEDPINSTQDNCREEADVGDPINLTKDHVSMSTLSPLLR